MMTKMARTSVSSMDTDDQKSEPFQWDLHLWICPESQIVEEIGRLVDIVNPKKS